MEKLNEKQLNQLLAKLRTPVHINFIAQYILRKPIVETEEIIQTLLKEELVVESHIAKNYFQIKN